MAIDFGNIEGKLTQTINDFVSVITSSNIIRIPTNVNPPARPYWSVETKEAPFKRDSINHEVAEATGIRNVTLHGTWIVVIAAYGKNNADGILEIDAMSLAQKVHFIMGTQLFLNTLEQYGIPIRSRGRILRTPTLENDQWEDKAVFQVTFGIVDIEEEFISFIETLEDTEGYVIRGPNDPNPIKVT